MAGVIYPMSEKGIKLVSAHMEETEIDENFAGEVIEDDGSATFPPIPGIFVQFNPSPYTIIGNRIVKQPQ